MYKVISKRNFLSILAIGNYKNDIFNQQAEKRGGVVKISESYGKPRLSFLHGDKEIELHIIPGEKRPESMHLKCNIDSSKDYRLFIYKKTFVFNGGLFQATGDSTIQISNPEFTKLFIAEGNEDEMVYRVLTSEIQQYFIDQKKHRPVIHLAKGKFDFSIIGRLKDKQELNLFIETGLAVISKFDDPD